MTKATGIGLKAIYGNIPMLNLATVFVLNVPKSIIPIIIFMRNNLNGASTIEVADGSRFPTDIELAGTRYQGEHVANVSKKLATL
jgi:hypothetical protein